MKKRWIFRNDHFLITLSICVVVLFLPFINKPVSIDSDMMIHVSKMLTINPLNPPLGEYGRHMEIYNIHTGMPSSSVYYRCPHPPFIPFLLAPVIKISNDKLWPLHAFMLLFYGMCVWGFFTLLSHMSPTIRNTATLLFATCPAVVVNAQNIMWDIPNVALILWSLAMVIAGVKKNSVGYIITSGIFSGLAAVTKMSSFPLYLAIPLYLLFLKKNKFFVYWVIVAVVLPLSWVFQNMIFLGKIQYLTTSHVNLLPSNIRYHLEQYASMIGGCMIAPIWILWLLLRKKNHHLLLVSGMMIGLFSSVILFSMKKLTIGESFAFFIFAGTGCAVIGSTLKMLIHDNEFRGKSFLSLLIILFCLMYGGLILVHPAAEVRFLLPIMAICIVWFCKEAACMFGRELRIFWSTLIAAQIILSFSLSYADYVNADSDKKIASWLRTHYPLNRIWYFGRLSYDYYLFQNGFHFLGLDGHAKEGDYIIQEKFPESYRPTDMIGDSLVAIPVDSVEFSRFPIRTMPPGGGFYGGSRLPFSVKLNTPQKSFVLFYVAYSGFKP